ncbi:MAG TPA: family 16 glycoside hydrolase [Bryobacteraceae bacterium]|jgi:hypothetical protein
MKLLCLPLLATAAFAATPFAGRWDITVTRPNGSTYAQWMEIDEQDGKIAGRIQPGGGAVRPIVDAHMDGSKLVITTTAATNRGPAVTWELTPEGDKFTGVEKRGDAAGPTLAGVRAPALKRPMPKAWTAPEPLFNGKDLTGWEPVNNPQNSKWIVDDGTLFNSARGSNIRTTRKFDDFKLHIEVKCDEHCNSGIYLRGRYEIQVGTEGGTQPSHEMGSVYGYVAPKVDMPLGWGEWQVFDITLVGRTLTVTRNGKVIHENLEIPGITGGALDSHEAEPGPFFLQGDHEGGMRYRNITVSVPKP